MLHDEARKKIIEALEQDIKFDGHFNKCFDNIKETQQNELIFWVKECKGNNIGPIQSKKDRSMIGFVNRFGSNLRAILTKRKKGYYIALFLDKHKYYESEMESLGF